MPGGAPTKYTPEFCQRVIAMGKEGMSKAEMALELDVPRSCFAQYEIDYPEFSEAVKTAVGFSQGWWEKNGRIATFGGHSGFNANAYSLNMRNRFKEDWQDKQHTEHSGGIGVFDKRQEEAVAAAAIAKITN